MSYNNTDMGLRIKQCRKAKKMTQEQLAEAVDISPHYLYEIERGSKLVSLPILADIALTLQTSMDYLVFGNTPDQFDYFYTDELQEFLIDLNISQRNHLCKVLKALRPYLKL